MSKGLEALEYIKHKLSELEFVLRHSHQKAPYIEEAEWNIIEKELKTLEIIKDFIWMENGEIHLGLYGDVEITLREDDFESKEEYDILKETLTTEELE